MRVNVTGLRISGIIMIYIHASLTVILTIKTVQTTGVRGSWMLRVHQNKLGNLLRCRFPAYLFVSQQLAFL